MLRNVLFRTSCLWRQTTPAAQFLLTSRLSPDTLIIRNKYINYGVQGKRESKNKVRGKKISKQDELHEEDEDEGLAVIENDPEYENLATEAMHVSRSIQHEQNVLVIQPFIRFGPKRSAIPADVQLEEAEALIKSLDNWNIYKSIKVGLETFQLKTFFGKGKLEELKQMVDQVKLDPYTKITCIFISRSTLTYAQKGFLEELFQMPVMDRFSVVIQILRMHAKSRESRLQVALAEIPYIWHQLGDHGRFRGTLNDSQKLLLKNREKTIKVELEKVRGHRVRIRKQRALKNFPIIAVVGYTNAGKTALIKALTSEETIEPQNKLFATLEITAHGGVLPCNLQVIFMDTIGFMADIPTGLMECFLATLEDAMMADLVIHVQDLSHLNSVEQRKHVERTLQTLLKETGRDGENLLSNVITVGSKCDLVTDLDAAKDLMDFVDEESASKHIISSTKMTGINDLRFEIERRILKVTKRIKMIIRIPMSGEELAWLYKNTAVTRTVADPKNAEYLMAHVVITDLTLQQFKTEFLKKKP